MSWTRAGKSPLQVRIWTGGEEREEREERENAYYNLSASSTTTGDTIRTLSSEHGHRAHTAAPFKLTFDLEERWAVGGSGVLSGHG